MKFLLLSALGILEILLEFWDYAAHGKESQVAKFSIKNAGLVDWLGSKDIV